MPGKPGPFNLTFNTTHTVNNIVRISIAFLCFISLFLNTACQKEKGCTDPKALNYNPSAKESDGHCQYPAVISPQPVQLNFHLHQHFGTPEFDTATHYLLPSGVKIQLSQLRFYLSNVRLINLDGTEILIPESWILVKPGIETFPIGTVTPGKFKGVKFLVGIDSASNSGGTSPADRPAGHPLGFQSPSMFWSWASGYIFVRMEGSVDTTGTGTPNLPFVCHVGSNALKREVQINFTDTLSVSSGVESFVHLKVQLDKLFDNVNLKVNRNTHTMDNLPLATQIVNNAATMFSEE